MEKNSASNKFELYDVAHFLSEEAKSDLGLLTIAVIYLQDPLVAEDYPTMGPTKISLDWEPGLSAGPTSERIAVVDYDADSNTLYDPAKWSEKDWCFVGADNNTFDVYNFKNIESPQFRQVNVWAVIHDILSLFQHPRVMGRPIPWAFEGSRIIVVPNAGYAKNAFYDRSSKSLQFYRCGTAKRRIYTCLSHDIVAHETGHAVLDGIRPFYNEISSIQTSAFHEFLADLTSIITALRFDEIRYFVVRETGGDFSQDRVIGDLAEILGQDLEEKIEGEAARPYLRTAHNKLRMDYLSNNWSCHDCSNVLTGAMFEILTKIALKQLSLKDANKEKDFKLNALWEATTHFARIALRALDYCPPVDIQFIDYARALLRADQFAFPLDGLGYRDIIREVFHSRGFCKEWRDKYVDCDLEAVDQPYKGEFYRYDIDRIASSTTAAYHFLNMNRKLLSIPENQDVAVVDLYDTNKQLSGGIKLSKEIVLEYIWREDVLLEGKQFGKYDGELTQLLCGGTLVFDERGNVLYFVHKPGLEYEKHKAEGEKRKNQLLKYISNLIKEERVGLAEDTGRLGLGLWKPAVEGKRIGGSISFEATPGLRCHRRRGDY